MYKKILSVSLIIGFSFLASVAYAKEVRRTHDKAFPSAGLVAYWGLDGSSIDSVSGEMGVDTEVSYNKRNGFHHKGASFDGVSSGIFLGAAERFNLTSDLTISMWVYPLGGEGSSVFAKTVGVGDSNNPFDFQVYADARLQFVYANGTYYFINSAATVPVREWSFVTVTRSNDNQDIRFYINGELAGLSNDHWAAIMPLAGGGLYMGRRESGNFFKGSIDELGVWNRALSKAEIKRLFNKGKGLTYESRAR